MPNNVIRKGLVIGIILLLVSISVILPSDKIDVSASKTIFNDGNLSGYVNNIEGHPIEGALVRVYFHEDYEEDYSDKEGYYHVTNIPICYCYKNATCSKECYTTEWVLLGIYEDTTYDFVLNTTNHPPNAPEIEGEHVWEVGVEYEFVVMATDPDGDDIAEYIVNFGDGTPEQIITGPFASGERAEDSHIWTNLDDILIIARAKDTCGFIGPEGTLWQPPSRNMLKTNPIFIQFLERFIQRFPLIDRILNTIYMR